MGAQDVSANREVWITGMGVVTPIGNSVEEFTRALFEGRSGAAPVTRFDASRLPTRFAAEVKNFSTEWRDVKLGFALDAAAQAMKQAFGGKGIPSGARSGLSMGLGLELFSMDDLVRSRQPGFQAPTEGRERVTFLNTPSDLCVGLLGREHGLNRPPLIHISACAAGTDALGSAMREIREGRLDVALAGGADSMINPMGLGGFSRIGAPSQRNDSPQTASRPFDSTRDGFLLGEGAGFLVLEAGELARKRGAACLGKISGYANSLDAYSVSDPHPQGEGALRAMRGALSSAGLSASDLSAISAHATSTPKNDPAETAAIRTLLGPERADQVPVIATKSLIGHLISAAGAVEAVAAVECMRRGRLHATLNLTQVAPDCRLRHVTQGPLEGDFRHMLKNSFGFGGQNACIILSRAE